MSMPTLGKEIDAQLQQIFDQLDGRNVPRMYDLTALDFFAGMALAGASAVEHLKAGETADLAWAAALEMMPGREDAHRRLAEIRGGSRAQVGVEGDVPGTRGSQAKPVDPGV